MQTNTWDYQWVYSIWKNKGHSITPRVNLVLNLGLNDNSSYTFLNDSFKNNLCLNVFQFPIKHPTPNIDLESDRLTFNNMYSRSVNRLMRLFKENSFSRIVKYLMKKYLK